MEIREILISLFSVNSIWSVVARGVLWFGVALIIIMSVDANPDIEKSTRNLKANLGFFFLFVVLSSVLTLFLFDFQA